MFFLNKSVQLLLLLVLLSQGQGAPSHGDQLAAEEDEEIEDSEDNLKVFEADEQKTQEEIDSTPGVSEDDDARGSVDITEDTSVTTTQSSLKAPLSPSSLLEPPTKDPFQTLESIPSLCRHYYKQASKHVASTIDVKIVEP